MPRPKTIEQWKVQSPGMDLGLAQAAWKQALKLGGGDKRKSMNYYQLLLETAMQESKLGKMDRANPMQLTQGTVRDFKNRYAQEFGEMVDAESTPLGKQMGMAALIYRKRMNKDYDISTLEGRAKLWKDKYNTSTGAGTPEKYVKNNAEWKWGE